MKKQEVKMIPDSSAKLVAVSVEKLIKEGYHICQVVPLNKTTFMVIVCKEIAEEKPEEA